MRLISDPATRTYKVRQVLLVAAIAIPVLIGTFSFHAPRPTIGEALPVTLIFAGCFAYTMRRRLWFVADAVSEDGASLLVRRGATEVAVPLHEVADVYPVNVSTHEGLQIALRSAIKPFGTKIVFLPPEWQTTSREQMDQVAIDVKRRLGIAAA